MGKELMARAFRLSLLVSPAIVAPQLNEDTVWNGKKRDRVNPKSFG
jgi:hypothetical protein